MNAVRYEVDLSNEEEKPILYKFFVLQSTSIKKFQILKLRTSENVWISAQVLQRVQNIHLISQEQDNFNLKFEELGIPYPKTNFKIEFLTDSNDQIQDALKQYPKLFDIQRCDITINNCLTTILPLIEELINKFPSNLKELKFSKEAYINREFSNKLESLRKVMRNKLILTFDQYLEQKFGDNHNEQFTINNLSLIQRDDDYQVLSFKSISKFKILSKFELKFVNSKYKIQQHPDIKLESPPTISIVGAEIQEDCPCFIQQVLNGFCKHSNTWKLMIENFKIQYRCQYPLKYVYKYVTNFINLTELRLPMGAYDSVLEDIKSMLNKLPKLSSLYLYSATESGEYSPTVCKLCEYAIDNLREMSLMCFKLYHRIPMPKLNFSQRVRPLFIEIIGHDYRTERYLFDSRSGIAHDKIK
ncbi:hypothetical protein FGO68_gene14464 [Halteria grandinella]|uniref:Uncharacterized protein n=1 Tax=Halteria grandinella TaxID=5974 RepID=A0A8J8T5W1_HALGN|nr:hypothetical protein FGO68_gene14464 [Halteria grandinella]